MANIKPTFHQDLQPEGNYFTLPICIINKNIIDSLAELLDDYDIPLIGNDIICKFHLNYMFIYVHFKNDWNRIDFDLSEF